MTSTIGSLTNVPAAGDPIASQWTRDVSALAVHVFASKAALDAAWGSAANGSQAWTTDTNIFWVRVSGAWRTYQQRGTGTLTFSANATSATLTVTYPYAFAAAPIITATSAAITNNTPVSVNTAGVSATAASFIGRVVNGNSYSGTVGFYWLATLA